MNVSFNGFNDKVLTFRCEDKIEAGYPLNITSKHTVSMANGGDSFVGFCLQSDGKNASVLVSGYVKMNYSGTVPTLGRTYLVCSADGSVQENSKGVPVTVLGIDETDTTVEFLF